MFEERRRSYIGKKHRTYIYNKQIKSIHHKYILSDHSMTILCSKICMMHHGKIEFLTTNRKIDTSGVHNHLNDRRKICSCVRCSKRGFMARSAGVHVLASWLRLGSSCLQRQSGCCCFVEKSGPSQRLQAYRSLISLCSGLRHFRKNRFREDIHNR